MDNNLENNRVDTTQLVSPHFNQLLQPFTERDTAVLDSLFDQNTAFYVRLQVSPFEAQAAHLLNALVGKGRVKWPRFNLFFCSSRLEAISGALKVVRHNRLLSFPLRTPFTAVYDPTKHLQQLFDPLDQGLNDAIVPGLQYFDTVDDVLSVIQDNSVSSVLITNPWTLRIEQLNQLLDIARQHSVYSILDESSSDLVKDGFLSQAITHSPDVITLGENLASHRVPVGCFMMSRDIYRVWNTYGNYNLHSNTWGGNSVSMNCMLAHLRSTDSYNSLSSRQREEIESLSKSHRLASKAYAKYSNPKMTSMLNLSNLNKDIRSASQSGLNIASGDRSIRVIDAAGTYGVNLRGHSPRDFQKSVLHAHDPGHDYWSDLERVFEQKTGLPHLMPAVSGTSANDIAISLMLTANFPKRRIIAMEMAYHGKTLASLAATYKQRVRAPFGPLYPHVSFVNPFSPAIEHDLETLFATGDVAGVALETIQGEGGIRPLPDRLLNFLSLNQSKFGYFILVDEVQSGMYRTGRFMNYQGKVSSPDLISMGKGMSDMVFPVAATAVSDRVFQNAFARNKFAVQHMVNMFRCQLGAHTALHAIRSADEQGLAERASELGNYFKNRLQRIATETGMVKEVRGEGLMIGFELAPEALPMLMRGSFGGLLASRFANDPQNPVLVAFTPDKPYLIRFLPPLTITYDEIDAVLDTVSRCLKYKLWKLVQPLAANLVNPRVWFPHKL